MSNRGTLGSLFIDLAANTATFETDMGRAARVTEQHSRAMRKSVTDAAKDIAGALAGLEIAHKIEEGFKRVVETADQIGKSAQKIGLTTEQLSAMRYAAGIADVQFNDLVGTLEKFNKNTVAARANNSDQARAFKALGVDITDANGKYKTTQELLLEVADRFSKAKDGADKTAIAMALFGKSGAELIPFLNQGATGLNELTGEAERFGLVISEKTAKAAEEFNDNLKRVKASTEGLTTRVVAGLLPTMRDLSQQFVDFAKDEDNVQAATRGADVVLKGMLLTGIALKTTFELVGRTIGNLAGFFASLDLGPLDSGLTIAKKLAHADWSVLKDSFADTSEAVSRDFDSMAKVLAAGGKSIVDSSETTTRHIVDDNNKQTLSFKTAAQAAEENAAALKREHEFKKLLAMRDHEIFQADLEEVEKLKAAREKQTRAAMEAAARVMRPQESRLSERMSADPLHAGAITDRALQDESAYFASEISLFEKHREDLEKEYGDSNLVIERAEQQHQARIKEIEKQGQRAKVEAMQATLDTASNLFGALAELQNKNSREGFERWKKFEIAQAIISTISGAIKAAESVYSVPYVGPYLAAAAAAAALATGYAQVQQIRSQSFEGRRSGGPVGAGGMYEVAEGGNPELLRMGGKTILMMGQDSGQVIPAKVAGAAGMGTGNLTVHLYGASKDAQARVGMGPNGAELEIFAEGVEKRLANNAALGRGPLVRTYREVFNLQRQGA